MTLFTEIVAGLTCAACCLMFGYFAMEFIHIKRRKL